jgi:hypothetical protein
MEFYWLTKTLVDLSMDDKEDMQMETLDKIKRLEVKFTVLCRVAFGINFKVQDWDPDNNDELINVTGTSASQEQVKIRSPLTKTSMWMRRRSMDLQCCRALQATPVLVKTYIFMVFCYQ